jgi:hypothetical protein
MYKEKSITLTKESYVITFEDISGNLFYEIISEYHRIKTVYFYLYFHLKTKNKDRINDYYCKCYVRYTLYTFTDTYTRTSSDVDVYNYLDIFSVRCSGK